MSIVRQHGFRKRRRGRFNNYNHWRPSGPCEEVMPEKLYGADCPYNELSLEQEEEICRRAKEEKASYLKLALEYGVPSGLIGLIVRERASDS